MPPEYIAKQQISAKHDVYSLGIVIIEIIVGPEGYSKVDEMDQEEMIKIVRINLCLLIYSNEEHDDACMCYIPMYIYYCEYRSIHLPIQFCRCTVIGRAGYSRTRQCTRQNAASK